jgi:hypothetical protein
MSGNGIEGVPGVLLQSSGGGTYFVPHSDLSKYRLADEAAAAVPAGLSENADHGTEVAPSITRITAHEVPLIRDAASGAAGFPMPESTAAAFPMPESRDGVASLPMPEGAAASLPMPESAAANFPMPEAAAPSIPMPESGASD